jgi:hypothetical protein
LLTPSLKTKDLNPRAKDRNTDGMGSTRHSQVFNWLRSIVSMEQPQEFVCTTCKTGCIFIKPENGWMLWMGWIMIVLGLSGPPFVFLWPPGLVLVIMAYRQRKPTCEACKSRQLVPANTPLGQQLFPEASRQRIEARQDFICRDCGTPSTCRKPDNGWMMWMGWVMISCAIFGPPIAVLWIPGLILVIISYRQRKPTCFACKSRNVIPSNTPVGRELLPKTNPTQEN